MEKGESSATGTIQCGMEVAIAAVSVCVCVFVCGERERELKDRVMYCLLHLIKFSYKESWFKY